MRVEELDHPIDEGSPLQPLIEMSQDCIVEWNESQHHADVRDVASDSGAKPEPQHLSSIGLEEVRRKLEQRADSVEARKATSLASTENNESESKSISPRREQEIEAIFNILEQKDKKSNALSPSEAPTQPLANKKPLQDSKDSFRSRAFINSSLVSRRRRRQEQRRRQQQQQQGEPQASKKLKQTIQSPNGPHTNSLETLPENSDCTKSAFDNILKQLETPQSEKHPSLPTSADKENYIPPQPIHPSVPLNGKGTDKPSRSMSDAQVDTKNIETLYGHTSGIITAGNSTNVLPRSTLPAAAPKQNSKPKVVNVYAKRPGGQSSLPKVMPPPSTTSSHTVPQASTTNQQDDEFDDLEFDNLDMTNLDSLLAAKSSRQALDIKSKSSTINALSSTNEHSTVPSMQAHHSVIGQKNPIPDDSALSSSTTKQPPGDRNIKEENSWQPSQRPVLKAEAKVDDAVMEDEFGDFPDFDFDVIDQAIAKREQALTQENQSNSALNEEIVRNPRASDRESYGLAFIRFTRYKVLRIEEDLRVFRKTLFVAEWKDEMLSDYKVEREIHKDCEVVVDPMSVDTNSSGTKDTVSKYLNYPESGCVQLRGQWYYTMVSPGDIIHVCSLNGRYRTDAASLPLILHSHPPVGSANDDLVLIHHPDLLMTPTVVSETVSCSRRAVLKSRNGSTGLSNKAALVGTLRHALFGICMKEQQFDRDFALRHVKTIVRENAESLYGCGLSTSEAERQLMETLPMLLDFIKEHSTFGPSNKNPSSAPTAFVGGHIGSDKGIRFATHATYSLEEPVVSPELALKGFVDAVMEATVTPVNNDNRRHETQRTVDGLKHSLMALELKTGHNQTAQHTHMAQLSLYTLMLQGRYGMKLDSNVQTMPSVPNQKPDPEGASTGGLLLYLNDRGSKATHVAPEFHEFKTLIANRNIIAGELVKAAKPRGITLTYENNENDINTEKLRKITLHDAPPAKLPEVRNTPHSCNRCFENRSCMLYAASEVANGDPLGLKQSHGELLGKFTGALTSDDLAYFRKWDRLIDLEAHASVGNVSTAWLMASKDREVQTGETMSSLVYVGAQPNSRGDGIIIKFRRGSTFLDSNGKGSMSIPKGSHVVLSTDGSSFDDSQTYPKLEYVNTQRQRKRFRHRMNVSRGFLEESNESEVLLSAKTEDVDRIKGMIQRYEQASDGGDSDLRFRLDKDNAAVGIGTLRQNLINLFTGDQGQKKSDLSQTEIAKQNRLPRLRKFIVSLEAPTFQSLSDLEIFGRVNFPLPSSSRQELYREFESLNDDQRNAVRKVLIANDYTLVQGLPGTGKTSTLSFIAQLLAAQGKKVLITSYTNSAVDNVVMKLMEKGVATIDSNTGLSNVVRVGPRYSCHEKVFNVHAHDIAARIESLNANKIDTKSNLPSSESLGKVMSHARIVCSTVLTVSRSPLLVDQLFDTVIVDEAGQTSQPAVIGALMGAESFVLVGDHKQLPPLVSSEVAQAGGYGESLLLRLAEKHPQAVAALTYQYRMNEEICKLSSYLVYGGRLRCGSEEVRVQRLHAPGFPEKLPPPAQNSKSLWPWLRMTVNPENPVVFVDTENVRTSPRQKTSEKSEMEPLERKMGGRAGGNVMNPTEATLVKNICLGLISCGVEPSSIGVISPYRAQIQAIGEDPSFVAWKEKGLEMSTIDRYQGRDKPVIIISFVRSNLGGKVGRLLQDKRRLNVALTRAKSKLILVGSYATLHSGSPILRPLLGRINQARQRQLLPDNALECYNNTF